MEATNTSPHLQGRGQAQRQGQHGKLTLNSEMGKSHWERATSQQLVFNIPNALSFLIPTELDQHGDMELLGCKSHLGTV